MVFISPEGWNSRAMVSLLVLILSDNAIFLCVSDNVTLILLCVCFYFISFDSSVTSSWILSISQPAQDIVIVTGAIPG